MQSLVESGSGVENKFRQCIFAILYLSPVRKGRVSSFEETSMPYIEEYFEPNLVEIGLTVLDEKFLKFRQVFLLFRSNLPLETFAQT